jgi:molybdate transport system regulatory protein
MRTKGPVALQTRLRIRVGTEIALGPGKAELLELIHQTGSLAEAARRMGMSYMRAWTLAQTMNRCFREPAIRTSRGGKQRGGAHLTDTGRRLLTLYQQMETECLAATRTTRRKLRALVKKS